MVFLSPHCYLFDQELFSLRGVRVLVDCSTMRTVSGTVIFLDASWCVVDGLVIPRPPSRTGNAKSSRVTSLKAFWPVREVRNFRLITSSSSENRLPMLGVVLVRYVHLLIRPCVNAAYAAWGYVCMNNNWQAFNRVYPVRHFLLDITLNEGLSSDSSS